MKVNVTRAVADPAQRPLPPDIFALLDVVQDPVYAARDDASSYFVGVRVGHLDTSLPGLGRYVDFHVGGWQLLFVLGMVVGWRWRDLELRARLLDRRVQIPATVAVVMLTLCCWLA